MKREPSLVFGLIFLVLLGELSAPVLEDNLLFKFKVLSFEFSLAALFLLDETETALIPEFCYNNLLDLPELGVPFNIKKS